MLNKQRNASKAKQAQPARQHKQGNARNAAHASNAGSEVKGQSQASQANQAKKSKQSKQCGTAPFPSLRAGFWRPRCSCTASAQSLHGCLLGPLGTYMDYVQTTQPGVYGSCILKKVKGGEPSKAKQRNAAQRNAKQRCQTEILGSLTHTMDKLAV